MTGKLLPFQTRIERAQAEPVPEVVLTPQELYKHEYEHALQTARDLVTRYKASANWDDECEKLMVQVVQRLRAVCLRLAAATDPTPDTTTTGETPNDPA